MYRKIKLFLFVAVFLFVLGLVSIVLDSPKPILETSAKETSYTGFQGGASGLKILGILIVVGVLLFVFFRFANSRTANGNSKEMELESVIHIGDKSKIAVILWEGKKYLVGITNSSFTVIDASCVSDYQGDSASSESKISATPVEKTFSDHLADSFNKIFNKNKGRK